MIPLKIWGKKGGSVFELEGVVRLPFSSSDGMRFWVCGWVVTGVEIGGLKRDRDRKR